MGCAVSPVVCGVVCCWGGPQPCYKSCVPQLKRLGFKEKVNSYNQDYIVAWVAIGARSLARVWCSAQEIPLEKRVPGMICMDKRVATSSFFENKSCSVSSVRWFRIICLQFKQKSWCIFKNICGRVLVCLLLFLNHLFTRNLGKSLICWSEECYWSSLNTKVVINSY